MIGIIISSPAGRWAHDLVTDSPLRAAFGSIALQSSLHQSFIGDTMCLGFVLLDKSWEFLDQCDSPVASAMVSSLRARRNGRHKLIRFVRHRFTCAAYLEHPMPLPDIGARAIKDPANTSSLIAKLRCQAIIDVISGCRYIGQDALIASWGAQLKPLCMWAVGHPAAWLIVRGHCTEDVTAIVCRKKDNAWIPPPVCLPPLAVLKSLRCGRSDRGQAAEVFECNQHAALEPYRQSGKVLTQFTVPHLVRAVLASGSLTSACNLGLNRVRQLQYMFPQRWATLVSSLQADGFRDPSGSVLCRARKRFDIACMLAQRYWAMNEGPFIRFLFCDASPQKRQSWEVFLSGEVLIPVSAVRGRSVSEIDPAVIVRRKAPLNTLGIGRVSLEDKLASVLHQAWLEYGPAEGSIRSLVNGTMGALTDMGVEFGIGDAKDIIPEFFGREAGSAATRGFLFPRALKLPGSKHIVDLILRSVTSAIPWFPAALEHFKAIVQWLHKLRKREGIMDAIIALCTARDVDPSEMVWTLRRHPTAFADWRWTTLHDAVTDILHVRKALEFFFDNASDKVVSVLVTKEDNAGIRSLVTSRSVFMEAEAVLFVTGPMSEFQSWMGGCDCHPPRPVIGEAGQCGPDPRGVRCPFKGLRARSISQRLMSLKERIVSDRSTLVAGQFGSLDTVTVFSAMTNAISLLDLKFHWISEIPYLIWQAAGASTMSGLCFQTMQRDSGRVKTRNGVGMN